VVGKGYRFIAPVDRPLYSPAPYRTYIVRRGNHEFALNEGETVLGRDPHSHIHIEHPSVSRRHARISVQADKLMLEDLASRNGTFVDGRKITGPVQLRDGTIIGLGAIALTFGVSRAPASTQPVGDVPGSLATESES
jgi:pSer/pThr/pTyr-binding forkhead associated (FHA) protein